MSNIDTHISIPKDVSTRDDLDFAYLKEVGIQYISQLGANLWTDYNSHDPGVTILEMLCYAISDLGMRINLPVEDLLASDMPETDIPSQFYKAKEIFPSKPITALDYRKLFIDIDEVKNCWLRTHIKEVYVDCQKDEVFYDQTRYDALPEGLRDTFTLKGLYDILVDFEDEVEDKEAIKEKIRAKYHANRNLCEDLIDIYEVQTQEISVCAAIEVENQADEEYIHAQILTAIENYFSPTLPFYSIKSMMEKGYTTDQIFDGPVLDHGFIDSAELAQANLRTEVRLSDIMTLIMNIEGVKYIKEISIGNCGEDFKNENDWLICIEGGKKPILCEKSIFNYTKGFIPLNISKQKVDAYLEELQEEREVFMDEDIPLPKGTYSENDTYTTIQNDFPDTYGIGINGLPSKASTERKSQAKQLKGYLLFFDKILAGYFSHLGKVKDILSVSGQLSKTFFTQAINDIQGFDELVTNYNVTNDELLTETIYREFDNNVERRNQVLDHLLARFAERFSEYTFMMKTLYGDATDEVVLRNKEAFLKDYKIISGERGNAFNFYKQSPQNLWNTDNVSGTQKRIARLLGIKDYNRRNVSNSFIRIKTEVDKNDCTVFRWEILDTNGDPIFRSTENYESKTAAINELHFTVLLLIETSKYDLEEAFATELQDDTYVSNIKINISAKEKLYSFSVINPEEPPSSTKMITSIHSRFYDTQDELRAAIFNALSFIENDFTEEGLFLVEHILLRPDIKENDVDVSCFIPICTDTCENCEPVDPYSFRVSIILPGYTYRFADTDFRNYMENVIKQELPAHVVARICWVGHRKDEVDDAENGLLLFENAYKEFLEAKTEYPQENSEEEMIKLKEFIERLFSLQTLYPAGRLIDCENDSDIDGQVILGKTTLGTL